MLLKERTRTEGRVCETRGIAKERTVSGCRVEVAFSIAVKRRYSIGRVGGAGGIE